MKNVSKAFIAVGFGIVAALSGCSSNVGDDGTSSTSASDPITVDSIMSRANDYLTHDIYYCGAPKGQHDAICSGAPICDQPNGPWDAYRSDCSGFVSYVWQIPADLQTDTAAYMHDEGGSNGWTSIPIAELKTGDALVAGPDSGDHTGHIKLFSSMEGNGALVYEEWDCHEIARKFVQAITYKGKNDLYFEGDSRVYHAIRRNDLTAPPKPPPVKPPPVTPPPVTPPVTPPVQGPPTKTPPAPSGCGILEPGTGLTLGAAIRSCDDRFELVMQPNGDLAEYGPLGAMWSAGTVGSGDVADMQSDGNLVVYGKDSNPLFASHTGAHAGARLLLQDDGNIVIYDGSTGLWATATTSFPNAPPKPTSCGALEPGQGLVVGESLMSCDGRFTLAMQTDGNLVAYEGTTGLWATYTEGKNAYEAVMQTDGNFVVYDSKGSALWSSSTASKGGSFLEMQTDGNVVIYTTASKPVWASKGL
ncbi:MAG: hypothetical protein ABI183_06345 [Polyangiaceae bacterium]